MVARRTEPDHAALSRAVEELESASLNLMRRLEGSTPKSSKAHRGVASILRSVQAIKSDLDNRSFNDLPSDVWGPDLYYGQNREAARRRIDRVPDDLPPLVVALQVLLKEGAVVGTASEIRAKILAEVSDPYGVLPAKGKPMSTAIEEAVPTLRSIGVAVWNDGARNQSHTKRYTIIPARGVS
jgi:hypothetical protein